MSFMNPVDRPPPPPAPPKTQEQKDNDRWLAAIDNIVDNIAKPQRLPPTEGAVWLSVLCARLSGGKAGAADAGEAADAALTAYKKRFPTTP